MHSIQRVDSLTGPNLSEEARFHGGTGMSPKALKAHPLLSMLLLVIAGMMLPAESAMAQGGAPGNSLEVLTRLEDALSRQAP